MKQIPFVTEDNTKQLFEAHFTQAMLEWCNWSEGKPGFTKIVVGCKNEAELYALRDLADRAGIVNAIMIDNGVTEFHGTKTATCLSIGPDDAEKIDEITGDLELL
jgi:peptidyl-tRNA hydrolase